MERRLFLMATMAVLLVTADAVHAEVGVCFARFPGQPEVSIELTGGVDEYPLGSLYFRGGSEPARVPFALRELDQSRNRIDLVYRNPGRKDWPPSFALFSSGQRAVLTMGSTERFGRFCCVASGPQCLESPG